MRIAIFTDSFLPFVSGVTFAVLNQANELKRRGHDVRIFRPRPLRNKHRQPVEELDPGIAVHDIPLSVPVRKLPGLHVVFPTFLSSFAVLRKFKPHVAHLHTEWGCGWEGLLASKLLKAGTVGTFHTFFAEPEYLKHFHLPRTQAIQKAMWKYSISFFNRCDRVVTPSTAVRDQLLAHGLKKDPVLLSNGMHRPDFLPKEQIDEKRQASNLAGHEPIFIYVGRISQEKSLEQVLEAFRRIVSKYPQSRLAIVGGGPTEKQLDASIKQQGLDDVVERIGHVPHHQLISDNVPRLGDIFVTASKTENQPVSILEAMAFGLPVIGPRAKGIPELVTSRSNGILFEPDDVDGLTTSMEELYTQPERTKEMGEKALEEVERHSISYVGQQLEDLYNAITRQE